MRKPTLQTAKAALAAVSCLAGAARGDITYTFHFDPSSSPEAQQVANSVTAVAAFYNQHGSFNKHWNVYHNAGIPTAEANYSGYMGYGGTRNERVVFHEAAHTFGMGTHGNYGGRFAGGVWQGVHGNQAQFDTYNDYGDGLHGDGHAIWPGGFNYDNEDGAIERHWHTRVMAGIRADMGILSFTREARHELAHTGGTAEFRVVSPVATGYQWHRNGVPLANGGDISGATGPVLRIANAEAADEGLYHCAATGAGETLHSRQRQLWVDPAGQTGLWAMDGNVSDSVKTNHATASGSPGYVTGRSGQAINLDGIDDSLTLPNAVGLAKDFTIATWIHWDGGGNWQRVFDFGTGIYQNVFLTPRSGSGGMRLAFKDSINGVDTEYQVNAPALAAGQWVHLAAVLRGDYATLYVNGRAVGTTFGIPVNLTDFPPTQLRIGRSQYPDPLLDGRLDDFRVYNHALDGPAVWELGGDGANNAPVFNPGPIVLPDAVIAESYSGQTLAAHASDADADTLSFTKLDGPAWLVVSPDGTLGGTPGPADSGMNPFVVRVTDPTGASSDADIRIDVTGTIAHWDFEDGSAGQAFTPSGQANGSGGSVDSENGILMRGFNATAGPSWTASAPPNGGNLAMLNADNHQDGYVTEGALHGWSPTRWTIECTVFLEEIAGWETLIGRDGSSQGEAESDFYLANNGIDDRFRINIDTVGGRRWILDGTHQVQTNTWYALAVTSDGATLAMWLDEGGGYQQIGTLDISEQSVAQNALPGTNFTWTFGRGWYNGAFVDHIDGRMDNIRFSSSALAPGDLIPLHITPDAPAGLVAGAVSATAIGLTWQTVPEAESYTVLRSATGGGPFGAIATGVTGTSHDDGGLDPGGTWFYVVRAVNAYGESPDSPEASATTWTPAEAWRSEHFGNIANTGDAADGEDPDKDLVNNLLERAFGGNPHAADASILPRIDAAAPGLSILYRQAVAATDLTFLVEESGNLLPPWSAATGTSEEFGNDGSVRQIRFTRPAAGDDTLFLRLRVTESP